MRVRRGVIRFLLSKFYRNLQVRIALVLGIAISIPVIFLGLYLINSSSLAVKKSVLNNHKEIILRAAEEISLILKRSEDILKASAAVIGPSRFNAWQQETVLVGLVLEHPAFIRISSFDLSGKMIATSDLGKFFVLNYTDNIMQVPLEGKTYVSDVRFRDSSHLPYLEMSVPVKEVGRIKAVLTADVSLRSMWDVVDGIRLGNTGRAFLVSDNGTLIASADKKRVLQNENIRWQKDVDAALIGRNSAEIVTDGSGRRWVSSYAPVPGTSWGIVLRQEEAEAHLFSRVMKWQAWLIIFFLEIIAIIAAFILARIFIRPLKALLLKLKGNNQSGLDYKVDMKRHDELGELVKLFNSLADKLKNARINEKFSNVGEAAVWVAHELKNSLAPIKSFVQLLPVKHADSKFIDKFQDIVPQEIIRCEKILKELSDFSSPAELKLQRINLKDVIDGVLKIMEEKFIEKGIGVSLRADSTNLYIQGDPERLKQVFINLFINAVSAMPGGGSINLAMSIIKSIYAADDSFVEVSISDTGMGIPNDRLQNIFEPFKTTKQDGMGLGLAISRRIIHQHRGEIWVESQLGKGAAFIIRLPQEALSASESKI